jgi:hypothetical protein
MAKKKKATASTPRGRKAAPKAVAGKKKYGYSNSRLVSKRTFERYLIEEGVPRDEARKLVELSWQ